MSAFKRDLKLFKQELPLFFSALFLIGVLHTLDLLFYHPMLEKKAKAAHYEKIRCDKSIKAAHKISSEFLHYEVRFGSLKGCLLNAPIG